MNIDVDDSFNASEALDKVVARLAERREEQIHSQAAKIDIQAAELKYELDNLAAEKWFQDLCSILKDNEEVVICSQTFANSGYPHNGRCFFVTTGDGLRIGFERHSFPFPASHEHFRWPDLKPGELYSSKLAIPPDYHPESEPWGTLTIRHRAPSSLLGLRQFDYKDAAMHGIRPEQVQEHLVQAIRKLQERHNIEL